MTPSRVAPGSKSATQWSPAPHDGSSLLQYAVHTGSTSSTPRSTQMKPGAHSSPEGHGASCCAVPAGKQWVKTSTGWPCPFDMSSTRHLVPLGQPKLLIGSQLTVQTVASETTPPLPSESVRTHLPPGWTQSESPVQNFSQSAVSGPRPKQLSPGAHDTREAQGSPSSPAPCATHVRFAP